VRKVIGGQAHGWLALAEGTEDEGVGNSVLRAGAVEIGCARDHRGEAAGLPFVDERVGDAGADFALAAGGMEGSLLGHGTVDAAVHVDVIEEDEAGAGALAGFDSVGHDAGPGFGPHLAVVFEAGEEKDDGGSCDGAEGLVEAGQVGSDYFLRAAARRGAAADETEGEIRRGQERGQFIADGAPGAE
jgi:hypothetical protein